MDKKHFVNKRLVYVVAIVMACAILLCPHSTEVILRVTYDRKAPGHVSRLYYDLGSGYTKKNSIKKSLKKKERAYTVPRGTVALCLDPCEGGGTEVSVCELNVYAKDGLILSSGENGAERFLEPVPDTGMFRLSDEVTDAVHRAEKSNYFFRGILILGLAFAAICFPKGRMRKREVCRGIIWGVCLSAWLYDLWLTYADGHGFYGQLFWTLAMLDICLIARKVRGRESMGSVNFEKLFSLFLLSQAICGSGVFGKRFESFASDILFYIMCFTVQLVVFWSFWFFEKRSRWYVLLLLSMWGFRYSVCSAGYGWSAGKALTHTVDYFGTAPGMLSLMGIFAIYGILWGIFGAGMAKVLYAAGWAFVFVTNMIEMTYHSVFVKAVDVLSVRDLFGIMDNYVSPPIYAAAGILAAVFIIVCVRWRKEIITALVPQRNAAVLIGSVMLLIWLLAALDENVYMECFEIQNNNNWSLETSMEKKQGFFAFSYINLKRFLALIPERPEGYSAEMVEETLAPFAQPNDEEEQDTFLVWEQKPDVIFLMIEAGIDPDLLAETYNVRYSRDPDPVLDQYELTTTLAPIYGGYTAKSEFEALTGMSDLFFQPGCVQYSAYFTGQSDKTYGIVDVFHRNGYETTAIHQNDRTFYNREAAYRSFGFDRFIAKGDYEESPQDYNVDRYMKNTHFLNILKEQLDHAEDAPQFIWGVTIESHSPYEGKYDETEIKVECDSLNEEQIAELEQYIQSVKNTDDMLAELIDYIDQRERPTLLVVFGDHLPRLGAWEVWKTSENPDLYYATVCAAYATQGTVKMDEPYLSMNYLAPFVVRNAGIDNEPFYNYLTWMEKQMPVVRSWRLPKDGMQRLSPYEDMQYDMLFAKEYFKVY